MTTSTKVRIATIVLLLLASPAVAQQSDRCRRAGAKERK